MSLDGSERYERLFVLLRGYLVDCKDDIESLFRVRSIEEQREILSKECVRKAMERAFSCTMDIQILRALFGEEATGRNVQDFATHFIQAAKRYLENDIASQSPFAAQLLPGRFYGDVVYPWIGLPQMDCDVCDKLEFVEGSMEEVLEKENDLDIVHVSNIPDWLSNERTEKLFKAVLNSLREGGIVIIRILNSKPETRSRLRVDAGHLT